MGKCPDAIKRLVDRFEQQSDQVRSPDYNETLIRIDFINPLMSELGWDIDNRQGFAERYREDVHETAPRSPGRPRPPTTRSASAASAHTFSKRSSLGVRREATGSDR